MRIYISGPITNDPDYYNKFEKVAYELVGMGYKVINPTELINVMPEDATHKEYMNICIRLLEIADTIVMLPGWEKSKGAVIEYGYALASDMNIIEWEYLRGGKDEQINDSEG